jgi:hypothetical protein
MKLTDTRRILARCAWLLLGAVLTSARGEGKYSGGVGSGASMAEASAGLGGAIVTMGSASNQVFLRGLSPATVATITVTSVTAAGIKAADDLRVNMPDGAVLIWDASVTLPVFGGTASNKVASAVSYTNGGRTVLIDVTADFGAGDTLTVGGLAVTNLAAAALPGKLSLDIDHDGKPDVFDAQTVDIRMSRPGGSGSGYAVNAMTRDVSLASAYGSVMFVR